MYINNLMTSAGDDSFYDSDFQTILESHLTYIKQLPGTVVRALEPFMAYKFEGDFFGLLSELRIPKQYHFFMMRLNDLTCPGDFVGETTTIIIPDFAEIDLLKSIYQTTTVKL